MFSKAVRCALLVIISAGLVLSPVTTRADVTGKSYTVLEFISFYGNWDCYRFEEDGTFISTYGLILGTYTEEDLCLFSLPIIGCLFSVPTYEVKIQSPSNPVYTAIDLSDFLPGVEIILGTIATDDPEDQGFFLGFKSPICAYPARPCCPKNAFVIPQP